MSMTKPGGEKIAAAPPCYGSEPLVEERTFFPPIGRSTKVRTIYASNFCSFTTNKEYDDGFPGILYQTGGLGWVNPNKSVHARSHHMENRKKISVGRNIGTTRVLRSGCKINFLRRRRQRLAALEMNRKKLAPAPNKPDTFLIAPGVSVLEWKVSVFIYLLCSCCDEHIMNGDKIAPPCVPIERRFKFTECHEASLFPGRTIKIRTMSDTQNMGVMKSVGNLNDLTSPPPSWNTLSDKLYRGKDIIGGFGRGAEENTLSCDSLFALLFIYIS